MVNVLNRALTPTLTLTLNLNLTPTLTVTRNSSTYPKPEPRTLLLFPVSRSPTLTLITLLIHEMLQHKIETAEYIENQPRA
jgi:hypothetical protein